MLHMDFCLNSYKQTKSYYYGISINLFITSDRSAILFTTIPLLPACDFLFFYSRSSLWNANWKKEEKENDVFNSKECRLAQKKNVLMYIEWKMFFNEVSDSYPLYFLLLSSPHTSCLY